MITAVLLTILLVGYHLVVTRRLRDEILGARAASKDLRALLDLWLSKQCGGLMTVLQTPTTDKDLYADFLEEINDD